MTTAQVTLKAEAPGAATPEASQVAGLTTTFNHIQSITAFIVAQSPVALLPALTPSTTALLQNNRIFRHVNARSHNYTLIIALHNAGLLIRCKDRMYRGPGVYNYALTDKAKALLAPDRPKAPPVEVEEEDPQPMRPAHDYSGPMWPDADDPLWLAGEPDAEREVWAALSPEQREALLIGTTDPTEFTADLLDGLVVCGLMGRYDCGKFGHPDSYQRTFWGDTVVKAVAA